LLEVRIRDLPGLVDGDEPATLTQRRQCPPVCAFAQVERGRGAGGYRFGLRAVLAGETRA
jgi:hypothetical protein